MATDNHTVHRDPLHHEIKKKDNVMSDLEFACCRDLSDAFHGAGGVGGLLAVSVDGDYYFPFYDNNGNVMGYADENRSFAARYDYDAFGNLVASSGPMADFFPHRFSTKYYDPDLGLYYYGHRWYSPELGRWISRDPMGENGGVNLYSFCHGNPICYIDLLGLYYSISGCNSEFVTLVDAAESVARQRVGIATAFFDDENDRLSIQNRLSDVWGREPTPAEQLYWGRVIRDIVSVFNRIQTAQQENTYGIICECKCSDKTLLFVKSSHDDGLIHVCPLAVSSAKEKTTDEGSVWLAALLVHELSHYYAGTKDDYKWQAENISYSSISKDATKAQFFEYLIEHPAVSNSRLDTAERNWLKKRKRQ